MDQLAGAGEQPLDVADPEQRSRTVRATIQASASLLSPGEHARLAELAVFAEDETIPVTLITRFWKAAGGLDELAAGSLIGRLADLALIALVSVPCGTAVTMHDVIRDYLREETAGRSWRSCTAPWSTPARPACPAAPAGGSGSGMVTAWWELPEQARYLREHLIEHLLAAGRPGEAEEVAADLRWAGMRLQASGPAAPYADLVLAATPRTERLARFLGQAAHLLAPTDPPHSLTDILYSRAASDPDWGPQARALAPGRRLPALANQWLPPDLIRPALRRVLPGHTGGISAMAVAPDGTWLAAADVSGRVLTWDTATGQQRAVIPAGRFQTYLATFDSMGALAIMADGARLITAHADMEAGLFVQIQVWDAATGEMTESQLVTVPSLSALALSPDGAHLVCGSYAGTLVIWDTATGGERATVEHGPHAVEDVAVSLGGTLVAVRDGLGALAWEPATGSVLRVHDADRPGPGIRLNPRHWRSVAAVVPDGTLVVAADKSRTVHMWDAAIRTTRSVRLHVTDCYPLVVAPNGTWLATANADGLVQTWDTATGRQRATLAGHAAQVTTAAVAPDGTWLATGDTRGLVRTWDTSSGAGSPAAPEEKLAATAVTFAPDGTWLATGDQGGRVRICDVATGEQRTLTGERSLSARESRVPSPPERCAFPALCSPASSAGYTRSRSPRTAPGSLPVPSTGTWGSGTPPPGSPAPSSISGRAK